MKQFLEQFASQLNQVIEGAKKMQIEAANASDLNHNASQQLIGKQLAFSEVLAAINAKLKEFEEPQKDNVQTIVAEK